MPAPRTNSEAVRAALLGLDDGWRNAPEVAAHVAAPPAPPPEDDDEPTPDRPATRSAPRISRRAWTFP